MTPKILVVEDRKDWRDIIGNAVQAEGGIVHAAASYDEAIAALQADTFDLVIVDPVLDRDNRFNRDGLSVVQQLVEQDSATPILIITGSLTSDLMTSLEQIYANGAILSKESWDPNQFRATIYRLMGNKTVDPHVDTTAPTSEPGLAMPAQPNPAPGQPRVLVVENRPDWQTIVTTILSEAGYFWRVVTNAQDTLHALTHENYHAIILDLKLQSNNLPLRSTEGWLLLDQLLETWPKTRVIVLSGRASAGDVADLLTQYPIVSFVEKQSFTPEAILAALDRATRAPMLRIQSLGPFRLWRDGKAIEDWEPPLAEKLVKLLLVRRAWGGYAVPADDIIQRLWGPDHEAHGRKNLLPLMSAARTALEPDVEPRNSTFILRSDNGYLFDLGERISWDLLEFREHFQQGRQLARKRQWGEAVAALEQGRKLYKGDFLSEDRQGEWVIDIQREIASDYCELLVLLADAYAAQDDYAKAIAACEDALHKDPLLENVYRRLMRYHYCNNDKANALKVYRDCLKLFEELFGESPTQPTRQLHQAITEDTLTDCHVSPDVDDLRPTSSRTNLH